MWSVFWKFAVLALAMADKPPKPSMKEMAEAIEAGEFANNFYTGEEEIDHSKPAYKLVMACIEDKTGAIKDEDVMTFQNDFQVDLAACCAKPGKDGKGKVIPDCVKFLEPAYQLIRTATSKSQLFEAADVLNSYILHLVDKKEL
mmetsp:Transcript_106827/g.189850  ORF Transcript_106827/g.189850 Transcript_106827/m.189850 type:complete len:144 (+) Transcript_106827:56-487(+)